MVVNIIINSIVESRMGYRDVPVLFYADDGLLLARSCGEAEDMIQMVIEVAGECGLNIKLKERAMYYYLTMMKLYLM